MKGERRRVVIAAVRHVADVVVSRLPAVNKLKGRLFRTLINLRVTSVDMGKMMIIFVPTVTNLNMMIILVPTVTNLKMMIILVRTVTNLKMMIILVPTVTNF